VSTGRTTPDNPRMYSGRFDRKLNVFDVSGTFYNGHYRQFWNRFFPHRRC
jgi:hypothetical protein